MTRTAPAAPNRIVVLNWNGELVRVRVPNIGETMTDGAGVRREWGDKQWIVCDEQRGIDDEADQ